jgi:hypothetical protein
MNNTMGHYMDMDMGGDLGVAMDADVDIGAGSRSAYDYFDDDEEIKLLQVLRNKQKAKKQRIEKQIKVTVAQATAEFGGVLKATAQHILKDMYVSYWHGVHFM